MPTFVTRTYASASQVWRAPLALDYANFFDAGASQAGRNLIAGGSVSSVVGSPAATPRTRAMRLSSAAFVDTGLPQGGEMTLVYAGRQTSSAARAMFFGSYMSDSETGMGFSIYIPSGSAALRVGCWAGGTTQNLQTSGDPLSWGFCVARLSQTNMSLSSMTSGSQNSMALPAPPIATGRPMRVGAGSAVVGAYLGESDAFFAAAAARWISDADIAALYGVVKARAGREGIVL